jgi:hypothetical protein
MFKNILISVLSFFLFTASMVFAETEETTISKSSYKIRITWDHHLRHTFSQLCFPRLYPIRIKNNLI